MRLNIRERCQKVFQAFSAKGHLTLRAIAYATGMSKSSVHRHQQAMKGLSRHKGKKVPDGLERFLYLRSVNVNWQGNSCF